MSGGINALEKPATALQMVARVALLAHEHKLADPIAVDANRIRHINITLDARAALEPWLAAMGMEDQPIHYAAYDDGTYGYWAMTRNWAGTGWFAKVKANVPDPAVTVAELDADTVAGLEEVAA